MTESAVILEEEVLRLYREPIIGASYSNTFGEENIKNLVNMYRELEEEKMIIMQNFLVSFSKSSDLATRKVRIIIIFSSSSFRYVLTRFLIFSSPKVLL